MIPSRIARPKRRPHGQLRPVFFQGQRPRPPLLAFAQGLAVHGIAAEQSAPPRYRPCDLSITWGHKMDHVLNGQRGNNLPYLILEHGYFGDRNTNISCGFNGLNRDAEFHNACSPPDRWEKHGAGRMKPWRTDGEFVLVCGQVVGDRSLIRCPDYPAWIAKACEAAKVYGLPVYFRPHPKFAGFQAPVPIRTGVPLDQELERAAAAVCWNSNSAVEAVLAGVPTVVCDPGSMAWPVCAHGLGAPLIRPDRQQWVHDLAYAQWTLDELASGAAWAHLRQHFIRPANGT